MCVGGGGMRSCACVFVCVYVLCASVSEDEDEVVCDVNELSYLILSSLIGRTKGSIPYKDLSTGPTGLLHARGNGKGGDAGYGGEGTRVSLCVCLSFCPCVLVIHNPIERVLYSILIAPNLTLI